MQSSLTISLFNSSLKEDAEKLVEAAPNEASNLRICGLSTRGVVRLLNELGTTPEHFPRPLTWNGASKDVLKTFQLGTIWNSGMSSVRFMILNYPSKALVTLSSGMIFSPKLVFSDCRRRSFSSNNPGLISYCMETLTQDGFMLQHQQGES